MAARSNICDRIDAALKKVALRGMQVRFIYLDDVDMAALDRAYTRKWRKATGSKAQVVTCSYGDHIIYRDEKLKAGKRSVIYSTHGVGVAVPKRLSQPVA